MFIDQRYTLIKLESLITRLLLCVVIRNDHTTVYMIHATKTKSILPTCRIYLVLMQHVSSRLSPGMSYSIHNALNVSTIMIISKTPTVMPVASYDAGVSNSILTASFGFTYCSIRPSVTYGRVARTLKYRYLSVRTLYRYVNG